MDDRDDSPDGKPMHALELSALMPSAERLEAMARNVSARLSAKVDLAPLMPSSERLEAMSQAVMTRAVARRARMRDALPRQLLRWSAPMLAAGVGLAACLWMVGTSPSETSDPASVVTQWAMSNEAPTATHIFETLGNEDSQ